MMIRLTLELAEGKSKMCTGWTPEIKRTLGIKRNNNRVDIVLLICCLQ